MKKLLFLVLIAFAISTVVEKTEADDVVLKAADVQSEWNHAKQTIAKGKQWLEDRGLYQPLVDAITYQGQQTAEALCKKHGIPGFVCSDIISWILRKILGQ